MPRGDDDFLWTSEKLAQVLHLRGGAVTIRAWLSRGRITKADGWVKVGRHNRFISRVVKERLERGLFGNGLDKDGNPVARNKPALMLVPTSAGMNSLLEIAEFLTETPSSGLCEVAACSPPATRATLRLFKQNTSKS